MEALTNADRISDLERRLESLPTDLETYFRHMLENIEDVYVHQTVKTFHIALEAAESLSLMTYAMLDEVEENPGYSIELPVEQMSTTDIASRCQDMELRINARCKDLLQITRKGSDKFRDANTMNLTDLSRSGLLPLLRPNSPSETQSLEPGLTDNDLPSENVTLSLPGESSDFSLFPMPASVVDLSAPQNTEPDWVSCGEIPSYPFFEYEVDFLHRTVKDFFQVNDIQRFVASRVPETFKSCALLCHAFLAQIKVAPIDKHHFKENRELSDLIDDLMHYVHKAEKQTAHSSIELIDELSDVIWTLHNSLWERGSNDSVLDNPVWDLSIRRLRQSSLGFAVQRDLQLYVTHKLDEHLRRGSPAWENDELVLDALRPSVSSKYGVRSNNRPMLRLLVERGVDLNRTLGPRPVWDHIMSLICHDWASSTNYIRIQDLETVTALLEVGAKPNRSPVHYRLGWVQFILIPSENWRTRSAEFEAALTSTIVAFCDRGIDPYWELEGCTLWCHFVRSIYSEETTSAYFCLESIDSVLMIIKRFMGLGAQLDDTVYQDISSYEDGVLVGLETLTVADILTRLFTKSKLEELDILQERAHAEGSNAEVSGAVSCVRCRP